MPKLQDDYEFKLKTELDCQQTHTSIIVDIASIFSSPEIIDKTGYSFCGIEPLEPIGQEEGGKTFDVGIADYQNNHLVLIEVKTTDGFEKGKKLLSDLREKSDFVKKHLSELVDQYHLDRSLSFKDIEFVYCVERGSCSAGLSEALKNQLDSQRDDSNRPAPLETLKQLVIWEVLWAGPSGRVFCRIESTHHRSTKLDDALNDRIRRNQIGTRISIPFLLTNHPWLILFHTISYLLDKNFGDPRIANKKIIKKIDMVNYAAFVASAGATVPSPIIERRAYEAIRNSIDHGVTYGLLEDLGEEVKIICRGSSKEAIISNIELKYRGDIKSGVVGQYVSINAKSKAQSCAVEDYQEKYQSKLMF